MSALDDARQAGRLAKHRPTLAYHRQEPYWASSPAMTTDCAVEGRYATILQTSGGELIAQAGRSLVRPHLDLAFLNGTTYGDGIPQCASTDHLNAHGGTYVEDAARMQALPGYTDSSTAATPGARAAAVAAVLALLPVQRQEPPSASACTRATGRWCRSRRRDDAPVRRDYAQHSAPRSATTGRRPHAEETGGASPLVYVASARTRRTSIRRDRIGSSRGSTMRGQRPPGAPARRRAHGDAAWLEWPGRWGRIGPATRRVLAGRSSTRSSGSARTRSTPTPADGGASWDRSTSPSPGPRRNP